MHRPPSRPEPDDVEWAFDGEGSAARWPVGDTDDMAPAHRPFTAGDRAVDSPFDEADDHGNDHEDEDGRHRGPHLRRLTNGAAAAALIGLVVLGLVRAYRGDRTHRLILRDVQHVVRLEADAMTDGDRALYMSLQDDRRRRALRRPDRAEEERRTIGPLPGVHFTDDPPVVTAVEVASKDAANTVTAVTATIGMDATDGHQVGRFEQTRRMVRSADGRWLHTMPPAADGAGHAVARFVASRIHAAFAAADEPVLRPLLAAANNALEQYCTEQDRCAGRARLAFGQADAQAVDVSLRLTAPNAATGWFPVDPAARALTTFGIARAGALRLDSAFNSVVRPDGVSFTYGQQSGIGRDMTVATALVDVGLAAHLDPDIVDAWADDTTAADAGLTLWHLGARRQPGRSFEPRQWVMDELPPRDVAVAARSFAAAMHRASPDRLKRLAGRWPAEVAARRESLWLSPMSIQRDFGLDGLAEVLGWPRPQAPFVADGAVVLACDGGGGKSRSGTYIAGRAEGIADLSLLACGGDHVATTAWSPDGSALAVACHGNVSQAEPVPWEDRGKLALVRRAATGGWAVAPAPPSILPATGTGVRSLMWAPDGRHLAIEAKTWEEPDYNADPLGHVRLVSVRIGAADPWNPQTKGLPLPAVVHPTSKRPVRQHAFSGMQLAWSPNGRVLAVAGDDGHDGAIGNDVQVALQPVDGRPATLLSGWAMAWSPDGSQIARLLDPKDRPDPAAAATRGTVELSVVDADTMMETVREQLDATRMPPAAEAHFIYSPAADVNDLVDLAWSDDGQWIGAAFHTSTRCGDAIDCVVGFAWQPESQVLRQVVTSPLTGEGTNWWTWRGAWMPGSARYALFHDDPDAMGEAGELAFVLDAPTGEVETVPRSARASLATLLPYFSPDGRWHARLEPMQTLIVEPTSGIGRYEAGDGATGWRFNRPFCSPYLEWSGGRSTE